MIDWFIQLPADYKGAIFFIIFAFFLAVFEFLSYYTEKEENERAVIRAKLLASAIWKEK